ncbi:MAG: hypothetical protein GTO45_16590 [Candidatus Aminicenantes bacterium]|nr:hypothetical protein [Candidatus Aminicenantes bacterium]NIM80359.1 hypothetical protein [Candidatus Aminicenantes bacterium]NIN19746.1 hypothetical protein [Candidatus Aminicenantes bacterium]NIN43628.1 hypothetical protein [Candidatus Aminicenantes bacterium]NIN86373.1 hypothetical protein [Candidatus Aminicenantes bacterium]
MIFQAFFLMEFKRFFSLRRLIFILLIFILSLYFVRQGIDDHRHMVKSSEEFKECEALSYNRLQNYTQFSIHGVRLMFVSSPASILFSHPVILANLYARLNSVITLDIYNNCKGKTLFSGYFIENLRFSTIILLLGSLFALFYGYDTLRTQEYLQFIASACLKNISKEKEKIFFSLVISRFILLLLTFLALSASMIGMVLLFGVDLPPDFYNGLYAFLAAMMIMMLFFFLSGVLVGRIKEKQKGKAVLIAVWLALLLIIPALFSSIMDKKAQQLYPSYKMEFEKLKIITDFEKSSYDKEGEFDRTKLENFRLLAESYWENEYWKIHEYEKKLVTDIKVTIDFLKNIFQLTPTTFYYMTSVEGSSRGYENFIGFFNYLLDMHPKVVRFYIDQCFKDEPPKMVPFITGDENLFKAASRVPHGFIRGLLVNLGYCLVLLLISLISFRKIFEPAAPKILAVKNAIARIPGMPVKPGEFKTFLLANPGFPGQLFQYYLKEIGSVFVCHCRHIPGDLKPLDFIRFFYRILRLPGKEKQAIFEHVKMNEVKSKPFRKLKDKQKGDILLAILYRLKGRIYIVDDASAGMPVEFIIKLNDWMDGLAKSGAAVTHLTGEPMVSDARFQSGKDAEEIESWSDSVNRVKSVTGRRK